MADELRAEVDVASFPPKIVASQFPSMTLSPPTTELLRETSPQGRYVKVDMYPQRSYLKLVCAFFMISTLCLKFAVAGGSAWVRCLQRRVSPSLGTTHLLAIAFNLTFLIFLHFYVRF